MITLAIESSCDDTSIAILENDKLLVQKTASQNEIHSSFGGVVPELAARAHTKNIVPLYYEALKDCNLELKDIDLIAVTYAPGLIGSLLVGVEFAKSLSIINNIPMIKVHHIAGHLHAAHLTEKIDYPYFGVVVSGGHTSLYIVRDIDSYEMVGYTLDDAIGEAYDKVAKMCNLGYPGGPIIDKIAKKWDKDNLIPFPRPMFRSKELKFSFSGLKTAVSTYLKKEPNYSVEQVAASFQKAAIDSLLKKVKMGAEKYKLNSIVISGGVAANSLLRDIVSKTFKEKIFFPEMRFCMDNGGMIGYVGYKLFKKYGKDNPYIIEPIATKEIKNR